MATIFYKTGGNFSALTPQKVVSSYLIPASSSAVLDLSTEQFIAFTPSDAGNMEGAFICFGLASNSASDSVTVKLQRNTGSWGDVAGATVTITAATLATGKAGPWGQVWYWCQFGTAAAITTDASTWRLSVKSSSAGKIYIRRNGANLLHAAVIATTTAYASGDSILLANSQAFVIDQSITAATLASGFDATIQWSNPPATSYTLTVTDYVGGGYCNWVVGSEAAPIPYAQQAVINITNFRMAYPFEACPGDASSYEMYGEVTSNATATLAAQALNGQANIVLTEDLSAVWAVGDTILVYGGWATNESKTISAMSGTTVTLNSNLSSKANAGWRIVNVTRAQKKGIKFTGAFSVNIPRRLRLSGFYNATGNAIPKFYDNYSHASCSYSSMDSEFFIKNGHLDPTAWLSFSYNANLNYNGVGVQTFTISNITGLATGSSSGAFVLIGGVVAYTISDIVVGGGNNGSNITVANSTISNFQTSATTYNPTYKLATFNLTNSTLNNLRAYTDTGTVCQLSLTKSTVNNPVLCGGNPYSIILGQVIESSIVNPDFSTAAAPITANISDSASYINCLVHNPSSFTVENNLLDSASNGSELRASSFAGLSTDHRDWLVYGRVTSVGDGLTDTTVHTAGAGKFAVRFEPASSANSLEWTFDVLIGKMTGHEITIAVWCKINSATYYAGTHGAPRLTVSYDAGSVAYVDAAETTDWQLLSVPFTPTTTLPQVHVTFSARTAATGSNAYVYWDDFATTYPAGLAQNLGGLDDWVDGFPVTPPIVIGAAANVIVIED